LDLTDSSETPVTAQRAAKLSRLSRWWCARGPTFITWNASLVNSAITGTW